MKPFAAIALLAVYGPLTVPLGAQTAAPAPHCSEGLDGVLWTQTAVEHDALYVQAYRTARVMLHRALKDKTWTAATEQHAGYEHLPPAVILDIDETILDNSPLEGELLKGGSFPKLWNEWVQQARAKPVPGALEFTRYAAAHRVEVIYVTNRNAASKEATRRNLAAAGFPLHNGVETIYCQGEKPDWGADKGTRRSELAKRYRILLLLGDDLGDFLSGVRAPLEERRKIAAPYANRWGERWIVLPNPMYGSWETTLYGNDSHLDAAQQLERKLKCVHGMAAAQ